MQFDSLQHLHRAFLVTPRRNHPRLLVLQSTPAHSEPSRLQPPPPEPPAQQGHGERAGLWCGEGQLPRPPGSSARPALPALHRSRAAARVPGSAPGPATPPRGRTLTSLLLPGSSVGKVPGAPSESARLRPAGCGRRGGQGWRRVGVAGGARFPAPRPRVCSGRAGRRAAAPTPTPARSPTPTRTPAPAATPTPEAPAWRPRVWPGSRGFFGMQGVAL